MNKYSKEPGDSILAMLEPGEYVLNRNAVNAIGKENLDELNFEELPRFDKRDRGNMDMDMSLLSMAQDVVGMQSGGGTMFDPETDFSATALAQAYGMAGLIPVGEQREQFEAAFKYDPSKELEAQQEMQEALSSVQSGARSNLQNLSSQARGQQARSGFAGSGIGAGAMDASRESIMGQYQQQQSGLQRGYESAVEGLRRGFLADAVGELSGLQGAQGTQEFTGGTEAGTDQYHLTGGAPQNPSVGDVYVNSTDGQKWAYFIRMEGANPIKYWSQVPDWFDGSGGG
tara:strand:+ start:1458 stop:2315 length:858 start_codon:yes stop_codon:yes gene_type:complete